MGPRSNAALPPFTQNGVNTPWFARALNNILQVDDDFWLHPAYVLTLKMKHNNHPHSHRSAGPVLVPVHFEFVDPTATTVCVAGFFNQWRPEAKTLHPTGAGHWLKETALAPGNYEYCLVVDGKWMPDPRAEESVPNPYGGRNSVLRVVLPTVAAKPERGGIPQSSGNNKSNA